MNLIAGKQGAGFSATAAPTMPVDLPAGEDTALGHPTAQTYLEMENSPGGPRGAACFMKHFTLLCWRADIPASHPGMRSWGQRKTW